jgi:hypothetical protein
MSLCDFFIVGAPKCGTTTLAKYLDSVPGIDFSNPKEVNYFSSGEIQAEKLYYSAPVVTSLEAYESVFSGNQNFVRGEGSVSYLFYPSVAQKIKDYNSSAKIIIMLRDPIERAFSHYLMDKRLGYVKKDFEEIFYNKNENRAHFQQYFLLGLYGQQIQRYIDVFGMNQIKVIADFELRNTPDRILNEICAFLNVAFVGREVAGRVHNEYKSANSWVVARLYQVTLVRSMVRIMLPKPVQLFLKASLFSKKGKPHLNESFRLELQDYYRADIEKLAMKLDIDYPLNWL